MIDSTKFMESFLQKRRFKIILPHIIGKTLLDFGGNKGELKQFVKQDYTVCNMDWTVMLGHRYDTIVSLAVIEHIPYNEVFNLFDIFNLHLKKGGRLIITTPCKLAHPILDFMSRIGLTDRANILEHKHYWNKDELYKLAEHSKLKIISYKKFQFGLNQLVIFEKEG